MASTAPRPTRDGSKLDDHARLAESGVISRALVRAAELVKANFTAAVEPLGLPVHLARAVLMLDEPLPMGELAARLSCDRSYITSLADQLEARGLVDRVPGEDRRVKRLALTEDGRTLRGRIAAAMSAQGVVLARLDDEQRAALGPILQTLLREPPSS